MNARFLRQIAGDEESQCLAGDNLIVDLDLSEANLPAGCQLAIGREVVVEITDRAHTGCGKFQSATAKKLARSPTTSGARRFTCASRYARIITGRHDRSWRRDLERRPS